MGSNDAVSWLDTISLRNPETLCPHTHYTACGSMEKVWDELKKIESQAQQIQNDAQDKAKKLTQQAKQDGEKLLSNSIIYGEEESQKIHERVTAEANDARQAQLKSNEETAEKLKAQAQKRTDKAVSRIVDSVLEEN